MSSDPASPLQNLKAFLGHRAREGAEVVSLHLPIPRARRWALSGRTMRSRTPGWKASPSIADNASSNRTRGKPRRWTSSDHRGGRSGNQDLAKIDSFLLDRCRAARYSAAVGTSCTGSGIQYPPGCAGHAIRGWQWGGASQGLNVRARNTPMMSRNARRRQHKRLAAYATFTSEEARKTKVAWLLVAWREEVRRRANGLGASRSLGVRRERQGASGSRSDGFQRRAAGGIAPRVCRSGG